MAPANENLSPPGSSTYSSTTMSVGDGTWDAGRNDFLLPNLVGLNFETMRYNGMGNRFRDMPGYSNLIRGHGILAVITFLFIVPAAIFTARFYGRSPRWALRFHIYLQVLTVGLTTVIFTLGWFAVGPNRSLTNPHHGIGLAIYVLILVQAIGGSCIHRREKKKTRRRLPLTLVLHQWLGRAIALLAIAQVPLGLTLYGSPKWAFVLYTLWMTFLVVAWFILSFRAMAPLDGRVMSSHGGTVIEDRKSSRFGGLLPLAAAGGAAALLAGRHRDRSRSRSRSRSRRDEVVPSRRGSGSYIEEEKYSDHRRRESGGMMGTLLKGAAVIGAGGLAKSWWDRRQRRNHDDEYSSVALDTPSRRHRRHDESAVSEATRLEEGRRPHTPILPGPGDPMAAAATMTASGPGPVTPGRSGRHSRTSSLTYSYDSTVSPSHRPQHGLAKGVMAGLGLGWFAKKMNDRRHKKDQDRLDRLEEERIENERRARLGASPSGPRLTGDGFPSGRRHGRQGSRTESTDLSSILDDPHTIRPGASIPPIPPALAAGAAGAAIPPSRSRHDITEHVAMPQAPPDPQGILHQSESGSESYMSPGGRPHRRPSQNRRRAGETAAAEAAAAAAGLAAEEEARRQRSRSRARSSAAADSPVSLKLKVHNDKDRNVTLRRLTEQEVAAEREARKTQKDRRRRADSLSSLSGSEAPAPRPRYRRSEREAERRAEASSSAAPPPPMAPLSPPHPAFAGGRKPKDSAYYSGRPGESSAVGAAGPGSVGSPESHGTWSGMSPGSVSEDPAERRRRRRLERNRQGGGPPSGTVEFT